MIAEIEILAERGRFAPVLARPETRFRGARARKDIAMCDRSASGESGQCRWWALHNVHWAVEPLPAMTGSCLRGGDRPA